MAYVKKDPREKQIRIIADTPDGKRVQGILNAWGKEQPANAMGVVAFCKKYGINKGTVYNGMRGKIGQKLLKVLEDELGYAHNYIVNGVKPAKLKEEVDKKKGYIDMIEVAGEVAKLRNEIYAKNSRVEQLEKDVAYLLKLVMDAGLHLPDGLKPGLKKHA